MPSCQLLGFSALLGDADIVNKDGGKVEVASFKGKIVGLYFSAHWCPPCRGFTPVLAEKYTALVAAGKAFECIFVSSDGDQESFDNYYASMPWLALRYSERDQKEKLSDEFGVRGIPSLVLLDGDSGELITKDGRGAIVSVEFDKLRTYEADKAAEAAALDEKMKTAPEEITHESHEHSLKKTTTEALGGPYGGGYGCDICEGGGDSWVYHCDACSFDAHPKCVGV